MIVQWWCSDGTIIIAEVFFAVRERVLRGRDGAGMVRGWCADGAREGTSDKCSFIFCFGLLVRVELRTKLWPGQNSGQCPIQNPDGENAMYIGQKWSLLHAGMLV